MKTPKTDAEFARHIIDFDPENTSTYANFTLPPSGMMARAMMTPIPWPAALKPQPKAMANKPSPSDPLPECDYLVVTWTVAEALALSDVLTPGYQSKTDWYYYAHNFDTTYAALIRKGAPAAQAKRLGSYFMTAIGGKSVMCFKSELHMSQDGPKLPIKLLWEQLLQETKAKLIITTGTAGGIGSGVELGDVIVAESVTFDCTKTFKNSPFHNASYKCSKLKHQQLNTGEQLMATNALHLPAAKRNPQIFTRASKTIKPMDVVTTDFFAFDDSTNNYKLQGLGSAVEMGDAVLGLVIKELGNAAPRWTAIRNASDPQIDGSMSLADQKKNAAQIYEKYGYWTTVCSAIATWAVIAAD